MPDRISTLTITAASALVTLCLWAGTQWAVAMLAYQPALASAGIELAGLKIYAPWQLFSWWLAFDAQAPDVFARAGAIAAVGGLLSGALALGEPPGGRAEEKSRQPTVLPAGRTHPMLPRQTRSAIAASSSASTMIAICAATVPSTCSPLHPPGQVKASASWCRRC